MQSIKIKGRLSYPALDKMTKMTISSGETFEHYGADIIFPKSDTAQVNALTSVLKKAVKDSFPSVDINRFIEQAKAKKRTVLKDGDEKISTATKPENYERAYKNSWYISAKNKFTQPLLVDRRAEIVSNPREVFYAGCWVIVKLNISAYELDTFKTRGFSCTLTGVQFYKNDERWGVSPKSNTSEFDDYGDESEDFDNTSSFASVSETADVPW